MFDLKTDGDNITTMIKQASFFPFKSGELKFNATSGQLINNKTYLIKFDGTIAPYVEYLEEGTQAHNIFNAFGKTVNNDGTWNFWQPFKDGVLYPFGIGGRFKGKFHPGSDKHKDFIKTKTINAIISYFVFKYRGEVR